MKRGLVLFLAMCAFAIAMVPREREKPAEQEKPAKVTFCASSTPCAWYVHSTPEKQLNLNITNMYCICSADTECVEDEDDANVVVYRCKAPQQRTSDS